MPSFLKKFLFSLFFISLFLNTYADYPMGRKKLKNPRDKKQMEPGYNETARVQVRGSWDLYVSGSFIYWQALEENLDLAVTAPNYDSPLITKKYYKMNFDWKPGLKVSAGIISDHDDWSVTANYTWLNIKNKASYKGDSNTIVPFTLIETFNIYDFFAIWYLNLDFIEIQLGRALHFGKKLTAQPYAALSLAYIDQKYYFNTTAKSGGILYQPYSRDRSDSWGLGPKIGLNTTWNLTDNFRCLANFSGEVLYTSYRIRNKQYKIYKQNNFHNLQTKVNRKYLRPFLTVSAGLSWYSYIVDDFWHIEISSLYEFHALWNQNVLRTDSNNSDLYLNGLTLKLQLDF